MSTTEVISNGSKWAGEPPDSIETLLTVLASHPLNPLFETCGNFALLPIEADGTASFFGNFLNLSHVFSIRTNDPTVVKQLTDAIRANQQRPDYLAQVEAMKQAKQALHEAVADVIRAASFNAMAADYLNRPELRDRTVQAMVKNLARDRNFGREKANKFYQLACAAAKP